MKYYNSIIIDDEPRVREGIRLLLTEYCPEIRLCGSAESASEGLELLKANRIELIFLDISMPEEDGFAFLQSIPKENYGIIFITAYEEYALKAIKASAIDYLLKPVNANELKEAVSKAIKYFELRRDKSEIHDVYQESLNNLQDQITSKDNPIIKITIAEQYGFRIINVSDLMYLQADASYTILHISGLDKIVATRSLGEFEKLLDNPMFFRIHKSAIINLNYLKGYSSFEGNFAELTDGTRISISRRKLSEFRETVSHFSKSMN